VTAPHKAAMAAVCHRLGEEATATGVVNTIVADGHGMLHGHNTDTAGVLGALRTAGVTDGGGKAAVVLGAGGAARAGAFALRRLGFSVTMLARSFDGAREFAKAHGVRLGSFREETLRELAPAVVVQATPLGSLGREPEERPLPGWTPPAGTVVFDMVYQPYLTRFLRDAAAAGAVVVPGVTMFLAQAAAQVRHFTGVDLEPAVLRGMLAGTAVTERGEVVPTTPG
jgi:shikimate dehydrogenase